MQPATALALKEWAVVVHMLGRGKQILLLRKGGLHERHGRFSTEPAEFFLFPTYVHQMAQGVVREAAADLRAAMKAQPLEDQVIIEHYATVEDLMWLDSRERLTALADLHCWTPETVAHRFDYSKTPGLYLFIVHVYRLPRPYVLPLLKRYGGCRSWVELAEPLSTVGAVPVLSDEVFAERISQLRDRLAAGSLVVNPSLRSE